MNGEIVLPTCAIHPLHRDPCALCAALAHQSAAAAAARLLPLPKDGPDTGSDMPGGGAI